jgi:hypothetical protein
MRTLAGFLLIPYGVVGIYRATELLRHTPLPAADSAFGVLLGMALVLGGLGLLLGTPAGAFVIGALVLSRGLKAYNARLLRGSTQRRDLWPGAAPDLALVALVALGGR